MSQKFMSKRNSSIDFLRIFLVIIVIIYHSGLPYFIGPEGLWYARSSTYNFKFFIPWYLSFNAFVLNGFFFIAGIFSYYSITKTQLSTFVKKRIKRLLFPLILGFLFIIPPLQYYYYLTYRPGPHSSFFEYLFATWFGLSPRPDNWVGHYPDMNLGHLWFLELLLIYSFVLVILIYLFRRLHISFNLAFWLFLVLIVLNASCFTYIMRFYHHDTSMSAFLGFIQVDYTHVLQNCVLYFSGVYFAKANYQKQMANFLKAIIFYCGLFLALLPFIIYYIFPSFENFFSNLMLFSIWESLTAVLFSIGSVTYLDTIIKSHSSILSDLGNLSYNIYIIHIIFVVGCQILFEHIFSDMIIKFFFVTIISIILSVLFAKFLDLLFNKGVKFYQNNFTSTIIRTRAY